ncbi:MAG: hypothetical protein ACLGSA_06610 [Acidobacteriota bacterium]
MRTTTLLPLLLLCALASAAGCVPAGRGGYYDNRDYEYGNSGYYNRGYPRGGPYNDQDGYERQQRRQEANCNMNWQNCVGICNQIVDSNQRYACVANCNNGLNQCKRR